MYTSSQGGSLFIVRVIQWLAFYNLSQQPIAIERLCGAFSKAASFSMVRKAVIVLGRVLLDRLNSVFDCPPKMKGRKCFLTSTCECVMVVSTLLQSPH